MPLASIATRRCATSCAPSTSRRAPYRCASWPIAARSLHTPSTFDAPVTATSVMRFAPCSARSLYARSNASSSAASTKPSASIPNLRGDASPTRRHGSSLELCSSSVLTTTGSTPGAAWRFTLSATRLIASVVLAVKITSYAAVGAPTTSETMGATASTMACLASVGWRQAWQAAVHTGSKVGVLAPLSRLMNVRSPAWVGTRPPPPISVCRSACSRSRPEQPSSASWRRICAGVRVSDGVSVKAPAPNCCASCSARAYAMTLMMAGVPASNRPGAGAHMTQPRPTSRAVPPPVIDGAPAGSASRSTASALTPSGRPMSPLDATR